MVKWEYKVKEYEIPIDELNQLGNEGWELVTYNPLHSGLVPVAVFKRPKNQG